MFSLAFRDSAGVEQAYVRGIYALSFSSTGKGGPLSLTAAVPIDLISPRLHLIDGVSLYDGLDEIWLGRVCGLPTVTANRQAGIVVAEGYINHLADDSLVPAYIDGRLERWGSPEAYAIASDANASRFITDKLNRVRVGLKNGQAYATGDTCGQAYGALTGYIKRFTASYSTNYDNAKCYAELLAEPSGTVLWRRNVNGGSSGTIDISTTTFVPPGLDILSAIPANTTSLVWQVRAVANFTNTAADNSWHGTLTVPKVYYQTLADDKTTTVLKNMLAAKCPKLSTDYSKITAGTYTLTDFCSDSSTRPLDVLRNLNRYEGYDFGVWDRDSSGVPRLTFGPHDFGTVHYFASLRDGRPDLAGDSLDGQYNAVDVGYQDAATNRELTATRTATHALLDAWGITRKPDRLSMTTTSLASANQGGDTLLDDKARAQGKGSFPIRGYVRDNYGRKIPAHRILPGRNILIRDLRPSPDTLTSMTSANVLNGINIFRIVQVDAKPFEATLQLDNEGDRLDFILVRKRIA